MDKRFLFACIGAVVVALLFFLGKTTEPHKHTQPEVPKIAAFDIQKFIENEQKSLSPANNSTVAVLEKAAKEAPDSEAKSKAYKALASFWKDSAKVFEPYAFYLAEASKLDNSEKSLNFAGQLFLEAMRMQQDGSKVDWMANTAISLFEKGLQLNPASHDLKIGLGSAYIFGKGKTGGSQATMQGIQQLLSVVREDSTNMRAQLALAIGGTISGQYDKAIERFKKVVAAEPNNIEAVAYLADTYAAQGQKEEAIKWYEHSKKIVNNPQLSQEVDKRIAELRRQ